MWARQTCESKLYVDIWKVEQVCWFWWYVRSIIVEELVNL